MMGAPAVVVEQVPSCAEIVMAFRAPLEQIGHTIRQANSVHQDSVTTVPWALIGHVIGQDRVQDEERRTDTDLIRGDATA